MAETLCPSCGLTPLPAGVSACPRCHEPFDFLPGHKKRVVSNESEATTFGGNVTSAVTAHPLAPVAVMFGGAALWALRSLGADGSALCWAGVGLNLFAAVVIFFALGPARGLASLALLGELGLALVLGRAAGDLTTVCTALHAAVAFSMVQGEPSALRRQLSAGLGLVLAAGAALPAFLQVGAPASPRLELVSAEGGYRLLLPTGYAVRTAAGLAPQLELPANPEWRATGFEGGWEKGVLVSALHPQGELRTFCQAIHHALGATNAPQPLAERAPPAFGPEPLSYELRTAHAQGRLTCAAVKGRQLALAVVSSQGGLVGAQAAFDEVGAGLSLK